MRKKLFLFFLFLFLGGFLLFLPNKSFAARDISIASDKPSIKGYEEMNITTSASGFTEGETIYIKGAFYQDSPSPNYFGYTKNGDNWIKNSESTLSQRSIKIGEWDGNLIVKSDFDDSGFKGEGSYKFKIGFYYITSGGNLSSVNWSSILGVNINEPDPTPSPSPTASSNSSSSTSTPTPTPSPSASPKPSVNSTLASKSATVAANAKLPKLLPTEAPESQSDQSVLGTSKDNLFIYAFIGGFTFLILAATVFFREKIRSRLPF